MEIKIFKTVHIIGKNRICPHRFKYEHTRIRKDRTTNSTFANSYWELFKYYIKLIYLKCKENGR